MGKLKTLQKSEMQEILKTIASTQHQSTHHLFASMSSELSNQFTDDACFNTVDLKQHIESQDDIGISHFSGRTVFSVQTHTQSPLVTPVNMDTQTQPHAQTQPPLVTLARMDTQTQPPVQTQPPLVTLARMDTQTQPPVVPTNSKHLKHSKHSSTNLLTFQSKRKSKQTTIQTRRVIFEKDGTRTTIEEKIKNSQKFTEQIESLTIFKTEHEIDEFVQHTTHLYETKLDEYAKQFTMIEMALRKWMCELHQSKKSIAFHFSTIRELVENSNLELEQKFDAVYCRLFDALFELTSTPSKHQSQSQPTTFVLPVLQQIVKYTMQTFPDGNLKVLHCKFGDDKFSQPSIIVSVPEILLRALPPYLDQIHAFFVVKFIPFKSAFMKHRRKLEIDSESIDETSRQNAIDVSLSEVDYPYHDVRFPEIDPRMCLIIKKISHQ